ncbi:gastricsin [Clonorchis sinensis]|uniref:Gastricsin n=1 Tax=Clonorchis sinensis TaxID=79923 RepID=G7Y6P1_CLOSI|nr:gastricsin [Clonorchis sinensis]
MSSDSKFPTLLVKASHETEDRKFRQQINLAFERLIFKRTIEPAAKRASFSKIQTGLSIRLAPLLQSMVVPALNGLYGRYLPDCSSFETHMEGNPITQVCIGGQLFVVLLDTGGWTRWIPSSKSTSALFAERNKYTAPPETSVSMNRIHKASYSARKYVGNVMMDELWFTFVEMVEGHGAVESRETYDGIIGMRRPSEDDESYEYFETTILDYVVNAGIATDSVFTFRFCGQHGSRGDSWFIHGNLEFGGTRMGYFHPPIVRLPLYQATQWVVEFTSIEYGHVVLCNPCRAHVDTGASDTFAPLEALNILVKRSVVERHDNGVLHVSSQNMHRLRPLKIRMDSHEFTLRPQELTRRVSKYLGVGACRKLLTSYERLHMFILLFWFRLVNIIILQYKRILTSVRQLGLSEYRCCETSTYCLIKRIARSWQTCTSASEGRNFSRLATQLNDVKIRSNGRKYKG